MVKSARRLIFYSWFFYSRKYYFRSSQSRPPHQGLVGNLLRAEGWKYGLTIFSHTHLEFFPRCHLGTILPCRELWKIHKVDHAAAGKGPRCAKVHKYFSYARYQGFWATFSAQVPRLSTQVHLGWDGVPKHSSFGVAYRYVVKIEKKFKQKKWDFGYANPK